MVHDNVAHIILYTSTRLTLRTSAVYIHVRVQRTAYVRNSICWSLVVTGSTIQPFSHSGS